MAALLEYLPLFVFFGFYKFYDIYIATIALIATSVLHFAYLYKTKGSVPKRHWFLLGLVVILGGLTVVLKDDNFIKMKPTAVYLLFAAGIFGSQWFMKKPALKALMGEILTLPDNIWNKFNSAWGLFFTVAAGVNLYVAFNYSQDAWVTFKVFGMTGATIVFAIVSIVPLIKYLPDEESKPKEE